MTTGRSAWKWTAVLLGLLAATSSSPAQYPGIYPQRVFAENPQPPEPPEFLGPSKGNGPDFPNPAKHVPASPFELSADGEPNGFGDGPRRPDPPLVVWGKGEYLFWNLSRDSTRTILATTSTNPNFNSDFGAIGQPGTVNLFGPDRFSYNWSDGWRATVGVGFDFLPALEVSYFRINNDRAFLAVTSDGGPDAPLLARPVLAAQIPGGAIPGVTPPSPLLQGEESVFLAGFPGAFAGGITIAGTISLSGVEANTLWPIVGSEVAQIDGLLGFRQEYLKESLTISNSLTPVSTFNLNFGGDPAGFGTGFSTLVVDAFRTKNQFIGGQFGLRSMLAINRLALFTDAKLALGNTQQRLSVAGSSTLFGPNSSVRGGLTLPGGILALPSNSGEFSRDAFTIIPELNVNLAIELHRSLRAFAGFNLFYWSDVVRPGGQLTNVVDTRQAPTDANYVSGAGATVPAPSFVRSDFWGYGFNFGLLIGF